MESPTLICLFTTQLLPGGSFENEGCLPVRSLMGRLFALSGTEEKARSSRMHVVGAIMGVRVRGTCDRLTAAVIGTENKVKAYLL